MDISFPFRDSRQHNIRGFGVGYRTTVYSRIKIDVKIPAVRKYTQTEANAEETDQRSQQRQKIIALH